MPQCVQLDEKTNRVIRVTESESEQWCKLYLGGDTWIKNTCQKHVGVDYIYYPEHNTFSPPQPYPSWTLNEQFQWHPPLARPNYENNYTWDEETQTWKITHVWVTDEGGPLQPGDGLVASNVAGYFTKGEPAVATFCVCGVFSNPKTKTYYSNNVSVPQPNVIQTSKP